MIAGLDGAYLMAFKDRLKPVDPPYEQVKAKVAEDYRRSQASELTLQEGNNLVKAVNTAIAAGKSFKDTCKQFGHTALEVPPFNRSTRSVEIVESRSLSTEEVRDLAFSLAAGKVSNFRQTGGGGFVLFVKGFQPVAEEQVKAELAKYADSLRDNRANYAYREWLSREVERSGVMGSVQASQRGE